MNVARREPRLDNSSPHEAADATLDNLQIFLIAYLRWRGQTVSADRLGDTITQARLQLHAGCTTREALERIWTAFGHPPPEWHEKPQEDCLPLIACRSDGTWVCVEGRDANGNWRISDLAGHSHLPFPTEVTTWAQLTVSVQPGDAAPRTARRLFREAFLRQRGVLGQSAVATVLINIFAFASSLYTMQVYDRVIPTQGYATLWVLCIGVLIAAGVEFLMKLTRARMQEIAVAGMDHDLSGALMQRLQNIRLDQFPAAVGTLSSQLRSYEGVRGFLTASTLFLLVDLPFSIIFILVIGIIGGPLIALVPATFLLLAILLGSVLRWQVQNHATAGVATSNRKYGLLVEAVEAAETVKSTGGERQMQHRWRRTSEDALHHELRLRRINERSAYASALLQQVSFISLITVGAYEVNNGVTSIGGLIACAIIAGRTLQPIALIPGVLVQWAQSRAAVDDLDRLFALETDHHNVSHPLAPDRLNGHYQTERMRFAYPGLPETLNLDRFEIRAGEKVGILGPIGSGKTTLLKLLAGLYKPSDGRVLLDGLDLAQIDRAALTRKIAYLPQSSRLVAGTLRDNLSLGLPHTEDARLLEVAQQTGLLRMIAGHPKGLDMPISEGGAGTSGGQKQLIALTRLMLGQANIWLLDEPTASLDEASEMRTIESLRQRLGRQDTLVLVTHKPALLPLVERLIVLTSRGIALDGPREEILKTLMRHKTGEVVPASGAIGEAGRQ
jgi:ATP-binding cassette subfamily C protein LapB